LKEGGKTDKFGKKWLGPFRIIGIEEERDNLILVSLEGKNKMKKVSGEKCKPYNPRGVLPMRPADEPLEKFWMDKNIEEEESEKDSEDGKELEQNKNNSKTNWAKFGLESSDDEEENFRKMTDAKMNLVQEKKKLENGQMEEERKNPKIFVIGRKQEEGEETRLKVIFEGKECWAITSCLEPNLEWVSIVPKGWMKEDWKIREAEKPIKAYGMELKEYVYGTELSMEFWRVSFDWPKKQRFYLADENELKIGFLFMEMMGGKYKWSMKSNKEDVLWETVNGENGMAGRREYVPRIKMERKHEDWEVEKKKDIKNDN
jgi:hypothetical protein